MDTSNDNNDDIQSLNLIDQLWQLWSKTKDIDYRNKLFFYYSEWLRMVTGKILRQYPHPLAEWQDYINLASIGLLQAIERFDTSRGTRFYSFAEPHVKGSILKGLSAYVSDRNVQSARAQSLWENLDYADDLESIVNVAVGLAFGKFLELGMIDNDEPSNHNPYEIYQASHDQRMLEEFVDLLPEKQRYIVIAHYYQHLSFIEISQLLEVSKSRVSQLHKEALARIRSLYEEQN